MKLENAIAAIVDTAQKRAGGVIAFFLLLAVLSTLFVSQHFAMNTDVTSLLDSKVEWRQREIAFSKAFPQRDDLLVIVIDGKDSVGADVTATRLLAAMQERKDLFRTAKSPEKNPYFTNNGLMLVPLEFLSGILEGFVRGQPMLGTLAQDPSLRGLATMVQMMLGGVEAGQVSKEDLAPLFARLKNAFNKAVEDPQNENAFRYLMAPENPSKFELRRFILAQPVMNYADLAPAEKARSFIRDFVANEKLEEKNNVRVRQTGSVAMSDEEFASISEGMGWAFIGSLVLIVLILFMALRSLRLIVPIFVVLKVGLVATTAFALLTVGSLNLISVAFAVMFTGIAVDFGIQFGVRYRDVRHSVPDLADAMRRTGMIVAVPLLLAALSTAAGFLSFTPTSYRGVAELGLIAGSGMVIAFILNITLLPALLSIFKPGPEAEAVGFAWAAPFDAWTERNRNPILVFFGMLFIGALIATSFLRFDFDPINLKDPKTESVSTMLELVKDPDTNPYSIDILEDSSENAEQLAERLRQLPEVDKAITLLSFVPTEQDEKVALIQDTAGLLATTLAPSEKLQAPSATEEKAALNQLAEKLSAAKDLGSDAEALAEAVKKMASAGDAEISIASTRLGKSVEHALNEIRTHLSAKKIDFTDIPGDLKSEWVSPEGKVRVEVYPRGDVRDLDVLKKFYESVKKVAPTATGTPVSIQESANTIKQAFLEAGIYSVIIIFLLLLVILKKLTDTLYVLAPLILSSALTLGSCALIGLPINFANIIALPLLLGLGVSYSIYFVVYWRQGNAGPLQSSMARAVLFSAATALVAFGSLSISNHMGTASMGLLLTLSLFYVLFTSLFMLPALLGRPVKC